MASNQPSDPKTPTFNFTNPVSSSTLASATTTSTTQQWATTTTSSNLTSGLSSTGFKIPPSTVSQNKSSPGAGYLFAPATQQASTLTTTSFGVPPTSKPGLTGGSPFSSLKTTASSINQPITSVTTTAIPVTGLSTSTATTTSITPALDGTNLTVGAKTPAAPIIPQCEALSFQQLEELILNKWTADLYEQEKVFYNQATQINIWDKVINENAEKLTQLHSTMEKVKKQQTKINDDLEVIATHQKDLEACLAPLEKEDLSSLLKGDPNRKNLYSNAKKIDSQIKSMSENLKETIEHINETSRSHDTEDPVIQVGRILNAHMESLRWIDEHTARMQDYFDSLLKTHDDLRRECDLSKH